MSNSGIRWLKINNTRCEKKLGQNSRFENKYLIELWLIFSGVWRGGATEALLILMDISPDSNESSVLSTFPGSDSSSECSSDWSRHLSFLPSSIITRSFDTVEPSCNFSVERLLFFNSDETRVASGWSFLFSLEGIAISGLRFSKISLVSSGGKLASSGCPI